MNIQTKQILKATALSVFLSTGLIACDKKNDHNHNEDKHAEHKETKVSADTQKSAHKDHDTEHKGIVIEGAYAKSSIPGQKMGSAFFTLNNHSDADITVTGISSDVAEVTELHTMKMDGDTMIMRKMEELVIPAQGKHVLSAGADHVMFINLTKTLTANETVTVKLVFDNGHTETVSIPVKSQEGQLSKDNHDHDHKHADSEHNHEHKHASDESNHNHEHTDHKEDSAQEEHKHN